MKSRHAIRRHIARTALVALVAVFSLMTIHARSGFVDDFLDHFPGTTLDQYTTEQAGNDCRMCHVPPNTGEPGNPYRMALIPHVISNSNVDVAPIDLLDSDGDGVINQDEPLTPRVDPPVSIGIRNCVFGNVR
jgi:hypothetical protein